MLGGGTSPGGFLLGRVPCSLGGGDNGGVLRVWPPGAMEAGTGIVKVKYGSATVKQGTRYHVP